MKRNLKNFNHWIAELRDIAVKLKVYTEGSETPMSISEIKYHFNKFIFEDAFYDGLTPQQAFDEERENMKDNY